MTLSALFDLKYNRFLISKALVIAPKKVAESTWVNEQKKWDHLKYLRVSLVLGTEKQRIKALLTPADVYVINRENTQWLVDYYRQNWCFDTVILDESSSFKNHQSKRFKKLCAVRHMINRIYLLTGTPASNSLIDLWAQIYLLDRGKRLGTRITGFRERYFDPNKTDGYIVYSWEAKKGSDEAIRTLIGDICVSMKASDYLELPDCISVTIPVVLDAKAKKAYDKLEQTMLLEIQDTTIDASTAAVLSNKLLQLCNGAVYDGDKNVAHIHDCKLEALMELLEGLEGHPVLVFYNFQHDRDRILVALNKTRLRVRQLKTPEDEIAWNRREIDVLLAHPASAAYGLNLQDGGNHVVWFGMQWNLELYLQANKRLHRQGQTQKVIIHHLVVPGGLDEDVARALEYKEETQEHLMLALKARLDRRGLSAHD